MKDRKKEKRTWKRVLAFLLMSALLISSIPEPFSIAASSEEAGEVTGSDTVTPSEPADTTIGTDNPTDQTGGDTSGGEDPSPSPTGDPDDSGVSEDSGTEPTVTPAEPTPSLEGDGSDESADDDGEEIPEEEPAEAEHQERVELRWEQLNEENEATCVILADVPEDTFQCEESDITMEVTEPDAGTAEEIKALMEKSLAEDKILGNYFLYNIVFKVKGETVEPTKAITITVQKNGFQIDDTKKANTFYYNEANSPAGNTEAEIVEITQKSDLMETLTAAGESTENIEDNDLSQIELNEDGTANSVAMEGRRSTVYGCYVEDSKTEKQEKVRFDYKNDEIHVVVTLTNAEDIPEGAQLIVTPVELTEQEQTNIEEKIEKEKKTLEDINAYDIKFIKDEEEVEPGATVKVTITSNEVIKTEDVAIYHVDDETKEVEDMNATLTEKDTVEFDTNHFSKYVIVNSGIQNPINVTIQQYLEKDDGSTAPIYAPITKKIGAGGKLTGYTPTIDENGTDKDYHYTLHKIVEVETDEEGKETETELKVETDGVKLESKEDVTDVTIRCYYQPQTSTYTNTVTYYDYDVYGSRFVKDQEYTLDGASWNYLGSGKFSDPSDESKILTLKSGQKYLYTKGTKSQYITYDEDDYFKYVDGGINATLKNDGTSLAMGQDHAGNLLIAKQLNGVEYVLNANKNQSSGTNKTWYAITQGIIHSLSGNNYENLNMGTNTKGETINEPGYFSDEEFPGKSVYKNYQLNFDRVGDTYTLANSENQKTHKKTDSSASGKTFFPLEEEVHDVYNTKGRNPYSCNIYYGMRYDFTFTLGDYIGDLNYSFTGDDDLWVFLDGELVLDLGGLHSTYPTAYPNTDQYEKNTVNLWDYITHNADGTAAEKSKTHQVSILFMERGGYDANCSMSFVIPNVTPVDKEPVVPKTGNLTIEKQLLDSTEDATDKTFTFQVKINGKTTNAIYTKKNAGGTYDDTQYRLTNGQLSLKANESATIAGLPEGTTFEVMEVLDGSYLPAYEISGLCTNQNTPGAGEYSSGASGAIASGDCKVTVTNSKVKIESGTTKYVVNKTWNDDVSASVLPEYITMTLYEDVNANRIVDEGDTPINVQGLSAEQQVSSESEWRAEWLNLPADKNYAVKETASEDYEQESLNTVDTFTLEETDTRTMSCKEPEFNIGKNNILFVKGTSGAAEKYFLWTPVNLNLSPDEVQTIATTIKTMSIEGHPVPDPTKVTYIWGLDKKLASGLDFTSNDTGWHLTFEKKCSWAQFVALQYDRTITTDIKNKINEDRKTSVAVSKVWITPKDTTLPESVTVQLYADGEIVEGSTLELQVGNDWKGTFKNFPYYKKTEDGKTSKIEYSVKESKIGNVSVDPDGCALGYQSKVDKISDIEYKITNFKKWQIIKKSSSSTDSTIIPLEDAVFTLKIKTKIYAYGKSDANGIVTWYKNEECTEKMQVLDNGSYILSELTAPGGYSRSNAEWKITIQDGIPVYSDEKYYIAEGDSNISVDSKEIEPDNIITYYYDNDPLYALPSAGGIGIYWYSIGGILLMIAAALILYKRNYAGEVLNR